MYIVINWILFFKNIPNDVKHSISKEKYLEYIHNMPEYTKNLLSIVPEGVKREISLEECMLILKKQPLFKIGSILAEFSDDIKGRINVEQYASWLHNLQKEVDKKSILSTHPDHLNALQKQVPQEIRQEVEDKVKELNKEQIMAKYQKNSTSRPDNFLQFF